jgi:hypothetical protein
MVIIASVISVSAMIIAVSAMITGCAGLAQPVRAARNLRQDALIVCGFPNSVSMKVSEPHGDNSITRPSIGNMGITSETGARFLFLCWVKASHRPA